MRYRTTLKRASAGADVALVGSAPDAAQRAVEELVAHYEGKARAVSRAAVAVGAIVGTLVGAIPLSPLRAAWPIPSSYGFATLLGGLVVGVLIGYVVGDPRAKLYTRMAEQARLQLRLEQRISQNDTRMAQLLNALTARAAAAAQRTAETPARPTPAVAEPPLVQPLERLRPAAPPPPEPAAAEPEPDGPRLSVAPPARLRTVPPPEAVPAGPPLSPPNASDGSPG
jgi:hypothetical protein